MLLFVFTNYCSILTLNTLMDQKVEICYVRTDVRTYIVSDRGGFNPNNSTLGCGKILHAMFSIFKSKLTGPNLSAKHLFVYPLIWIYISKSLVGIVRSGRPTTKSCRYWWANHCKSLRVVNQRISNTSYRPVWFRSYRTCFIRKVNVVKWRAYVG